LIDLKARMVKTSGLFSMSEPLISMIYWFRWKSLYCRRLRRRL